MKIILCSYADFNALLQVEDTLTRLGHSVTSLDSRAYRAVCSYGAKKLLKFGFKGGLQSYERKWESRLRALIESAQPDLVLFINGPEKILSLEAMARVRELTQAVKAKCAIYFVDTIETDIVHWHGTDVHAPVMEYLSYFDNIFVYEKSDVEYLARAGLAAKYVPLGYNASYESSATNTDSQQDKTLDIVFVGNAHEPRLTMLTALAREADRCRWRLKIVGPFYDTRYFWKKWQFARKYPAIARYLDARTISSSEVAELYRSAKICLNINKNGARSCNPRTFEILATGGFELVNTRGDYAGLTDGEHLATFDSAEELIAQVHYYLLNDTERECIAAAGREYALAHCSVRTTLASIITAVTRDDSRTEEDK